MKANELKKLERTTYYYESKLNTALSALAHAASLVLGYNVVADLCHGSEIEFRIVDNNDIIDNDTCVRMEDVIAKIKS